MHNILPFSSLTNIQLINELEGFTRHSVPLRYSIYEHLTFTYADNNQHMDNYDPDINLLQECPANQPSSHCSITELASMLKSSTTSLNFIFNNICSLKENFDNFDDLYLSQIIKKHSFSRTLRNSH